jgi:hypothetical protein
VKLAYGATQTAGILMISDTVFKANQPSLLLTTDSYIKQRGSISQGSYERSVVTVMQRKSLAELKQLAYSASILSAIYGYNGYREDTKAVKNVFFFLAGNFLLVSAMSFYDLATSDEPSLSGNGPTSFKIALLPYPAVSWHF